MCRPKVVHLFHITETKITECQCNIRQPNIKPKKVRFCDKVRVVFIGSPIPNEHKSIQNTYLWWQFFKLAKTQAYLCQIIKVVQGVRCVQNSHGETEEIKLNNEMSLICPWLPIHRRTYCRSYLKRCWCLVLSLFAFVNYIQFILC